MDNECATKLTQGNARIFIQPGGASPSNRVIAGGTEGDAVSIDTTTMAGGDITPIFEADPYNYGEYLVSAASTAPPDDFDNGTIMFREGLRGMLPRTLLRGKCADDFYIAYGDCKNPTDFKRGWNAFVEIVSGAKRAGGIERNGGPTFDTSEAIQSQYSFKALGGIFFITGIPFSSSAGTREIADVTYGIRQSGNCSNCVGIPETKDIYALMKGDGAAIAASVLYSTDGGKTFTALAITGIGATEQPVAIEVVGDYLVVVSPTAQSATQSGYYYILLDRDTGAPEIGATWTKVTTGFVNNFVATDAHATKNKLFIGTADGYIHVVNADSLAAGVETSRQGVAAAADIVRLGGACDTVVATTAAGDLLVNFGGNSIWMAVLTAVGASAGAVDIVDDDRYFAADNTLNVLKYSDNGGKTWSTLTLPLTPTAIQDIVAVNRNVIHVAFTNAGAGFIATTWDGGRSWEVAGSRILGLPSNDRINRLAVPRSGGKTIQSGWLAGAALDPTGAAGLVLVGATPVNY